MKYITLLSNTIFCFLRHTIQDGLHFWLPCPDSTLPNESLPVLILNIHTIIIPESANKHNYGTVDADWAADKRHGQYVSGIAIFLAEGPVIFCLCF